MARRTQTRERLVQTAGELFWRRGYAQTGVSSIMKRAGATSGSFYHFFPTKEDLLLAVLDAAGERIETELLGPADAEPDDPIGRVFLLADVYREQVGPGAGGFGIPVGTLVGELGPDHAPALRRVETIYTTMVSKIEEWFIGADHGERRSNEVRRLAEFIVAALEGAAVMALADRSAAPIDACVEQLRFHLEALAATGGSRAEEMPPPEVSATDAVDWKAW